MKKKIFFFIFFFLIILIILLKYLNKQDKKDITLKTTEEDVYSSNIIKGVKYSSIDLNGNEYIITASTGEIDFNNTDIIFLQNVKAKIILKDSDKITITSNFGKYNITNYDTIFSKNVVVDYLDNRINGEYLDSSFDRNSLIISKNVVYKNEKNILKADVVEVDIKTKDTKIFMHETNKKVNIRSID